jgi:hypothetical protein
MSFGRPDQIFSNVVVYREIAEQAFGEAQATFDSHCRPKDDGSEGFILTHDPTSASFKNSLIAIVFAGIAIETSLWLYGCAMLGMRQCRQLEADFRLEDRLAKLGIGDDILWEEAKAFRLARNDLVHERPLPLTLDNTPIRVAQAEAARALALMDAVLTRLTRPDG